MKNQASQKPFFVCIGPGKTGTTWLWSQLRQHPGIFLPIEKELNYFNIESYEGDDIPNPNANRPLSWYLGIFASAHPEQICGEFSPCYAWSKSAAERIHAFNPKMRIIALLRDPVKRTHSHYLFRIQRGVSKNISFMEAIEKYPFIVDRSQYYKHLRRYFDLFPRENIKVLFYEDIVQNPESLLLELEQFLGAAPFVPEGLENRVNTTGKSRYPTLNRVAANLRIQIKRRGLESIVEFGRLIGLDRLINRFRNNTIPYKQKPTVPEAVEQQLRKLFRSDVTALEQLLDKDLSSWK